MACCMCTGACRRYGTCNGQPRNMAAQMMFPTLAKPQALVLVDPKKKKRKRKRNK